MRNLTRKEKLAFFLIGIALVPALLTGYGVAETFVSDTFGHFGSPGILNATEGPEVTLGQDYDLQDGQPATNKSINLSTQSNGWINVSTTYSDTDQMQITVDEPNGTWTRTSGINTDPNTEIRLQPSDKQFALVDGGIDTFSYRNISVDDGVVDLEYTASSTGNITVETDATSGTQYGMVTNDTNEGLDVAIADSNGVLVFDEVPTQSSTQQVDIRQLGNLTIREENPAHPTITGCSADVIFYETVDEDPTIEQATDSDNDGVIDLTGLPVDEEFAARINCGGYYNRTVLIDDLSQQNTAFLLNDSNTAFLITFTIDDVTGKFTTEDASIVVQRAINQSEYSSGGFAWKTIAGDKTGAANELSVDLEDETRYRLRVSDGAGDTRIIGSYTVVGATTVTLRPSVPDINITDVETYKYNATQQNESGTETITFEYFDPDDATTDMTVQIYEQGNETNAFPNQTVTGPLGYVKITQTLTDEEAENNWVVEWNATRDGESIGDEVVVGQLQEPQLQDLPGWIQHAVSAIVLILIGALFSVVNVEVGAVTTTLVGGGFVYLGWLPVAAAGAVVVALFVVVLWKAGSNRFG